MKSTLVFFLVIAFILTIASKFYIIHYLYSVTFRVVLETAPPQECPKYSFFNKCGTRCPKTCQTYDIDIVCTKECSARCQCIDGFVLNKPNGICVPITNC